MPTWNDSPFGRFAPFFDGRAFDPARPIDYLAGFDIRSPSIALAALAKVNERGVGQEGRELLFSPQQRFTAGVCAKRHIRPTADVQAEWKPWYVPYYSRVCPWPAWHTSVLGSIHTMTKPTPPTDAPVVTPPKKRAIQPAAGEVITCLATGNTYTIGIKIGEGSFGVVYECKDVWQNDLAAKVLKPIGSYEKVRTSAEAEFFKLLQLRNPYITFVFDAFEYRDTFYIITERCYCPITDLFTLDHFDGTTWLMPIARCLLQAVYYLHLNNYVHQDIHAGNVFASFVKDEMLPEKSQAILFKLGDLGVARVLSEVDATNTRAQWMLPPEVLNPTEYGPIDRRIDIYHLGLLFLQLAYSKELRFTKEEILDGKPREMALALPEPYKLALEKALRRHVAYRTENAMELWRDLHTPERPPAMPAPANV